MTILFGIGLGLGVITLGAVLGISIGYVAIFVTETFF